MTLEETIEQVERMHKESRSGWLYALKRGETRYAERCKKSMDEFGQLAKLLSELQERRKQPEIIHCGECLFREIRGVDGFCDHITGEEIMVMKTDYCKWGERRTDDRQRTHG